MCSLVVEIRLTPVGDAAFHGNAVELLLRVVVVFSSYLHSLCRLSFLRPYIGFKPISFPRVVVGNERNTCTENLLVLHGQAAYNAVHRIREGQHLLSLPSMVLHGHLHGGENILNLKVLHLQLVLGPLFHPFADTLLCIPVLHGCRKFYQHSCRNEDG